MELTYWLANVVGAYLVLASIASFRHRGFFLSPFAADIEMSSRFVLAVVDALIGLAIIFSPITVTSLAAGIVVAVGWLTFLRAITVMLSNDQQYERLVRWTKIVPFQFFAFVAFFTGVYLLLAGLGFFKM